MTLSRSPRRAQPARALIRFVWPATIIGSLGVVLLLFRPMDDRSLDRPLTEFRTTIADFTAQRDLAVPEEEVAALEADELLYREYQAEDGRTLSLYVAYYGKQGGGRSIHSPSNCLPASGWEAVERDRVASRTVMGIREVNRTLIEHETGARALVYYWYQGRGRLSAGEYGVKLHLLRDAVVDRRTDESMVRIVFPLAGRDDDLARIDALAASAVPRVVRALSDHLPG